jgi:CoA:oxalate CoA-transferase
MIVQALGGMMSVTGFPGGPPTKAGSSIGDITGGLFLLAGVASALYHRERTGKGMKVDVSMLDGQVAILEHAVMRYVTSGKSPEALGNRHPSITPFEPFATADRLIIIAAGNDTLFAKLCRALGRPDLLEDACFSSNPLRNRNAEALKNALENVLRTAPAAHWLAKLDAAGVPCSLINTVGDAVENEQMQARNMIVRAGDLRMAGNPIKLSAFADAPTRPPAPDLDVNGESIRREFTSETLPGSQD